MRQRMEALGARLAQRRVAAARAAVLAADLPAGLRAVADGDDVAIGGHGLARAIAFDARLRAIGRTP